MFFTSIFSEIVHLWITIRSEERVEWLNQQVEFILNNHQEDGDASVVLKLVNAFRTLKAIYATPGCLDRDCLERSSELLRDAAFCLSEREHSENTTLRMQQSLRSILTGMEIDFWVDEGQKRFPTDLLKRSVKHDLSHPEFTRDAWEIEVVLPGLIRADAALENEDRIIAFPVLRVTPRIPG